MSQAPLCQLSILDLRVWVHLGCTPEEKYHPQLVSANLYFIFPSPPAGMQTDCLSDTVCYVKAVELIQTLVKEKTFNLIEHLTSEIYQIIQQYLLDVQWGNITLKIDIKKVSPPLAGVHGGVLFSYSHDVVRD